ncbi:sensor histidine kinase [Mycolicibacterium pallens]|uniref:sensor histidine kinase n=1 Tax=Mycolicibacterium pallens TaxID=370524 RepID=UPI000903E2DD|nr:HAMP domain-containing sensor histidine kinase [Mycolicibacterium pallens]APE18594.1 ATP-binding protein [Mycobacterium sp. WY10]
MRPLDRLTNTDDGYALARIVVAVRTAIVLAIGVVLLIGPAWARQHAAATFAVLGAALLYAAIVLANAHLEVRRTRYSWLITALDSGFTLAVVALTGGAYSPVVSVPVAVIVASAARLSFAEALTTAVLFSAAFIPLALATSPRTPFAVDAAVQTGWWAFFVVCIAIITAGLSALAEREHRSRVHALVEAEAEHAAAEEERDLRARLLRSYQSQQDGLQVLVHEFRTPIASLEALMSALTSEPPMSSADRDTSLRLADRHVHHLADMIEALSDVALSRRPTFSSGRVRRVDVTDVVTAAADAVGLTPPRLRLTSTGDLGAIVINAQGLRRVLTNLLENASRHSRDAPVDVTCTRDQDELVIAVLDRGPGIPVEDLGELTAKYVSAGGQRGTAGLGLWIVQQIVEAMGGRVDFAARGGGGLAVTFRAPIES